MLNNEKLKELNDQIRQFKKNDEETKKELSNVFGTKKDYFEIISIKLISVLLLMSISYWIYSTGLVHYEDIVSENITRFTFSEYFSSIVLSFTCSIGGIASLFLPVVISDKNNNIYKNTFLFFKDIFVFGTSSNIFGFILSICFCFSYIPLLYFFDLHWSFFHNVICFLVFLPFFCYLSNKEAKCYFNNKKEREEHISNIKKRNEKSNLIYTNKINPLKETLINQTDTLDKYNYIKIICAEMDLTYIESFYNEIEDNILKETEFDDFTIYEESIIKNRVKLNIIENI